MSDEDGTVADVWRIQSMRGGSRTFSHGVIAVTPGCPAVRHPTMWCKCKVFRSRAEAQTYIDAQTHP
jgi:hypothetical protein